MPNTALNKLRILSLDGGEARCLSQLGILREFMHRLKVDTGKKYRPCDYFDWIGGTGAGGVVATLLVTFSMSAGDAFVAFSRMCDAVFPDKPCTSAERALNLEAITKALLEECGISHEAKLMDESSPSGTCKLGLFYMAAANLGRCRLFRNYESRQASYNPTIVQAIRVAWATPGLFPPASVGIDIFAEDLVSATHGFNNPTLEVIKEAHQVFGSNACVSSLMSLGAGRAAVRAIENDGSTSIKTLEQLAMDCEHTADEVERRIGRLGIYFRFSVDHGLELDTPSSSMGKISAHTTQYLLGDHVSSRLDVCIGSAEKESPVTLEQLYRSQTKSSASLRGLPPLSSFFVMRQEPMNAIIRTLIDDKSPSQRIVILAGLGGSGKTQLTVKFARDLEGSFQFIMFVDASSADTIKKGLLTRVRALGREYSPETIEDALDILADPENPMMRDWLIIYDNADDPDLDLSDFIPNCDNGAIIITTRNTTLRHMAPKGYLELDVMSPEEAKTALLSAALAPGVVTTPRDLEDAAKIVELLGYLPVAIIQAGCYIRQQECLHEYEDRLKANRKGTLERPAKNQRDKLKYGHSAYAAFDITLDVLSSGARRLLNLLSTIHHSNFPRPLISVAAKTRFAFDPIVLLDRPSSFQKSVDSLMEMFCPKGNWDDEVLAGMLEELQQYSLVTLVRFGSMVTLRLHPLVHGWVQDRMSEEETEIYRDAAVRLVVCVADGVNVQIQDYLLPHVALLLSHSKQLHVNDRIALLQIWTEGEGSDSKLGEFQSIYEEVKSVLGERDLRTTRAALELASAYGDEGDVKKMEEMEAEVVKIRESLLGREDLETAKAMLNLAETYITQERYDEAEALGNEILKLRTEKFGVCHEETSRAMELMAEIYFSQGRYVEVQAMLETLAETETTLFGRSHPFTTDTLAMLSDCHARQGHHTEADALKQEILTLESANWGTHHIETLRTMVWTASEYADQKRFNEAEKPAEQAMEMMKEVLGAQNLETLDAIGLCARIYQERGRLSEAEALRREEIEGRKLVLGGKLDVDLLHAKTWLVKVLHNQGRFAEMEISAKELVAGRIQVQGEDHVDTLNASDWLARAYFQQRKYTEAEGTWLGQWERRVRIQGEKHPDTMGVKGWLARCAQELGRYEEALKLRQEEVALRIEAQGSRNSRVFDAQEWVALAYLNLHRYEEAETLARTVLASRTSELGELDPSIINSRGLIAAILRRQGKLADSASLYERVLRERVGLLGDHHAVVARTKSRLAQVYEEMGRREEAKALGEEAILVQQELLRADDPELKETRELLERLVTGPVAREFGPVEEHGERAGETAASPEAVTQKQMSAIHMTQQLSTQQGVAGDQDLGPDLNTQFAKLAPDPVSHEYSPVEGSTEPTGEISAPVTTVIQESTTHMTQQLPPHQDAGSQILSSDVDDQSPQQHTVQSNLNPPYSVTRPVSPFQQRTTFGRSPNPWSMFM